MQWLDHCVYDAAKVKYQYTLSRLLRAGHNPVAKVSSSLVAWITTFQRARPKGACPPMRKKASLVHRDALCKATHYRC